MANQQSNTPISDEMLENEWPVFAAMVFGRLNAGRVQYGDPSFHKQGPTLAREILQEISDISGWSFILHCRVRQLEQKLAELERLAGNSPDLVTKSDGRRHTQPIKEAENDA